MKKALFKLTILIVIVCVGFACSKSDVEAPTSLFDYSSDGLIVTFTNMSKNATSYVWDFGDGKTSTEANPVHTYTTYGEFDVTLTATNEGGSKSVTETISMAKPLILIDGDFSDWSEVAANKLFTTVVPSETSYGKLKKVKVCADADFIYCYVEVDSVNVDPFSIMIDCDNNYLTGRQYYWNNAGLDICIEGRIQIHADTYLMDGDVYKGVGSGESGTWESDPTMLAGSNVVKCSSVKTVNGVQAFEIGIIRAMLPTPISSSTIKMCFKTNDAGWNKNGILPLNADGSYNGPALDVTL
ncbi:MAG: PKD domain-containing protein [Bacteroidales bacterium]|nr:PKD domain-containing protein [Bacteroidales bacterium]